MKQSKVLTSIEEDKLMSLFSAWERVELETQLHCPAPLPVGRMEVGHWKDWNVEWQKYGESRSLLKHGVVHMLFFSHSLTSYKTPQVRKCLEFLREEYPYYGVVNPECVPLEGLSFDDCMTRVLFLVRLCDLLVFYRDGSYSPGVDMEIAEAKGMGIPLVELRLSEEDDCVCAEEVLCEGLVGR